MSDGAVRTGLIDVDRSDMPSFGLADEFAVLDTGWHTHNRHQILYAVAGSLHLEAVDAQWLLPPQRAAFIPAGCQHRVRCQTRVALRTVYLSPSASVDTDNGSGADNGTGADNGAGTVANLAGALAHTPVCVFAVTPLAREMILYAMRWGPTGPESSPACERESIAGKAATSERELAAAYFRTLSLLAHEWMAADVGLRLPRPTSPDLERAFRYALEHLDTATAEAAARAAGVSSRTLTRRFQSETQMSWRAFLRTARILRALELLAQPGTNVTEAAFAVGFENLAGFSKSFRALTGESPRAYQKRVT